MKIFVVKNKQFLDSCQEYGKIRFVYSDEIPENSYLQRIIKKEKHFKYSISNFENMLPEFEKKFYKISKQYHN